ncbi:Mitochondrial import receptor subunit TOM40 [Yarrowia sp. B02]|nr:Mitochondrial import receptor subunit TOM40 [Yarrowia sp. B02]
MSTAVPSLGEINALNVPSLPGNLNTPNQTPAWTNNALWAYLTETYNNIAAKRSGLNLVNPGTLENLNKEVSKDVFLTNYFFTGLRAEISKTFSMNPAFQVSHSFSLGSKVLPPYAFAAFFANDNFFMQGNIDNDYSVAARMQYSWSKECVSKVNAQLQNGQPAMIQLEQDLQGADFSINFKSLNPSVLSGHVSGVYIGSLLQSLTPKLAVGLEAMYSAQDARIGEAAVSYFGRYVSGDWVASAQLQQMGMVQASFWRKITDKVEAGVEANLALLGKINPMMGGTTGPEGTTTIGAKYEFRQSVYRGQIDSTGKVSCLLERRVLPVVSLLFAGEIDHVANTSKVGLGLQFEAGADEEMMAQQQQMMEQQQQQQM